jgi:carbonic anhydrase
VWSTCRHCRFAHDPARSRRITGQQVRFNVPLILVLGHESCGAIDATIKSIKDATTLPGHMPSLVTAITPAVKAVLPQSGDVLDMAIRQNVVDNVARLSSSTPILSAAVEQKKLKVVGGVYRLKDGKVDLVA